jgi:hypothetical protein
MCTRLSIGGGTPESTNAADRPPGSLAEGGAVALSRRSFDTFAFDTFALT